MSGRTGKRATLSALLGVFLAASAASAEQTATYVVRGLGGAAVVGVGEQTGSEVVTFAFSEATPEKGDPLKTGPRLVFSVTQWAPENGVWVLRQWYGDTPLDAEKLVIALDLTKGQLAAEVVGTLEEHRLDGSILRRESKGKVQIEWVGSSGIANQTAAFAYQTSGYATALQTIGTGRTAITTGTITAEGLDGPTKFTGLGTLSAVTNGLLSVKTP